jgi:hypothetical protein
VNGVQLLRVDVWVEEVRVTAKAVFSTTTSSDNSTTGGSKAGFEPGFEGAGGQTLSSAMSSEPAPITNAKDPSGDSAQNIGTVQPGSTSQFGQYEFGPWQ